MRTTIVPNLKRYLVPFNTKSLPVTEVEVLVIGSGIAALRAAIEAAKKCQVLIVTKKERTESSSFYAQGGIAAALSTMDTAKSHINDTLKVGWGLSDKAIVGVMINEGKKRVRELIGWGVSFDKKGKELSFAKEGGHSLPRVLHKGDETGAEIESLLLKIISENENIKIVENTFAIDILTEGNTCYGALVYAPKFGIEVILAKKVIIASGGIGQLYRETTNPSIATGDGIAIAYRAGAQLQDMEFVQFHPTTLYLAGATRSLISEAVRGAGGKLIDRNGKPFMKNYHPMGDLAPRDIVSRAILEQMKLTEDTQVYLDVRHLGIPSVRKNFPGLYNLCEKFGVNLSKEPIPVRPSAHYMVGGIKIDRWGRTSIDNLYACGEVSASGFHGANRLASNSLLECLVVGRRAGLDASNSLSRHKITIPKSLSVTEIREGGIGTIDFDIEDMKNSLRSLMWRNVGIIRTEGSLRESMEKLKFWASYVFERVFISTEGWELQNMLLVSTLITSSALTRRESRGVHYRADFPKMNEKWVKHITI